MIIDNILSNSEWFCWYTEPINSETRVLNKSWSCQNIATMAAKVQYETCKNYLVYVPIKNWISN